MCLLCLYSPQHHTTPKGLGDHWKPGCKRQMWSSCVPAPSYSCVSAPELSVLDHKYVGNIISPCPNSQKVARKICSNSYRRVNSVINSSTFMDFCSLDLVVHMLGFVHPEHRNVEKQGLQRPLSDPQCFGGALSFASWSLSKGACWWMFGMWMHRWENGEMI